MIKSLVQYRRTDGSRGVAVLRDRAAPVELTGVPSILALARQAVEERLTLGALVDRLPQGGTLALGDVKLLAPIDHEDPAHLLMTGTGLTHLGSAEDRDKMHQTIRNADMATDSMKMFLMGVEGGKPATGAGAQPEWFYKGDGSQLVDPGEPLCSPDFAEDAGEEAEIAGIYLIGPDGNPIRLGFALANEFSDHVVERGNYLWLAHSKLRPAALGPELLISGLPDHIEGTSRIRRGGEVIWERPFVSGEANMAHSIRNLEHHHFKYALFRRPGDVHVHFFGAATLSFGDGVRTRDGDVFEITASPFTLPVSNPAASAPSAHVTVSSL